MSLRLQMGLEQSRFGILLPPLLLLVLFWLLVSEGASSLWLKFLLAKFIYSTSDGAVLFLLGFSLVALACTRLQVPARWSARALPMAWTGLISGYLAHLAATLHYFWHHDIPLSAHVYHWSAGQNSYTSLLHSHLGKVAMAPFASLLPTTSHYDAGTALVDGLYPGLALLIGFAFLLAAAGVLLRMPNVQAAYGRRPTIMLVFLVTASNALKSLFDGGLLAYAVPISLVLLASFMFQATLSDWSTFWRRYGLTLAATCLGSYAALWMSLTSSGDLPLAGPWLFFIVVLLLLASGAWRGWPAWLARALMLAYLSGNLLFDYGDNLAPLLQNAAPDMRIVRFDDTGSPTHHSLQAFQDQPVFRVYRALGDDPWKPRNVLIWRATATGQRDLSVAVRLETTVASQGTLNPAPALRITRLSSQGPWIRLDLATRSGDLPPLLVYGIGNALSRNNYYVWMYQIDRLLRGGGWESYVLMPHTAGNSVLAAP